MLYFRAPSVASARSNLSSRFTFGRPPLGIDSRCGPRGQVQVLASSLRRLASGPS